MSDVFTGVRLELWRGIGKWLVVPLAALGIFAAEHDIPSGAAIWPVVMSALGISVELMGPFAAGAAAYAGSRSRRRGTDTMESLASRSTLAPGLVELFALLAWVLVAFLVVLAVVFIPAARSATWSGPDPTRTIAAGLGLLLEVAVGFAAGRVVPRRFTPLAVAVVIYAVVAYNVSIRSGFQWALLTPVNLQQYDQFDRLNHAVPVGQTLWYIGLAIVAVSAWGLRRDRTPAVIIAAIAGFALSVSGGAVLIAQHGRSNQPGVTVTWSCAGSTPQICIHPALSPARAELDTAFAPIVDRLRGTPFAITRIEQRPRGIGSTPTPGAVAFALDDPSTAAVQLASQDVAVNSLGFGDSCFSDTGAKPGYYLSQLIAAWVAGKPALFVPGSPAETRAQTWFDKLTDAQKRSWLATHDATIRRCNLSANDFR